MTAIANVALTNTFDEWRTRTNQVITYVNDLDGDTKLINIVSNTDSLMVTANVGRNQTLYVRANLSSNVRESSNNFATANSVNIVYKYATGVEANTIVANTIAGQARSNAAFAFQTANNAQDQGTRGFGQANLAFGQANTAIVIGSLAYNAANYYVTTATTSGTTTWAWNSTSGSDGNAVEQFNLTGLDKNITISTDSGSPKDAQKVILRIKPLLPTPTSSVTLTWTTGTAKSFRSIGIPFPTTVPNNKTLYVGAVYNAADQRWDVLGSNLEV